MLNKFSKFTLKPKVLSMIFISVAAVIFTLATIEIFQSKKELVELMENQAKSLLQTMIINSENAIKANNEIENKLKENLLSNVLSIKILFEKNILSKSLLKDFTNKNNLREIKLLNSEGFEILSAGNNREEKFSTELYENVFFPLIEGITDTILNLNYTDSVYTKPIAIAAVITKNKSIIYLEYDSAELLKFRNEIGFGKLLQAIANKKEIRYIALQSDFGIIAMAGTVDTLENIEDSDFLKNVISKEKISTRILETNGGIYEAVQPFYFKGEFVGLFRLGLSTEPLDSINRKIISRIIIISFILITLGTLLLFLIFSNENYKTLKMEYNSIETFSNNVIENVTDGIVVTKDEDEIILVNRAAKKLFKLKETEKYLNKFIFHVFKKNESIATFNYLIGNKEKFLFASENVFSNEKNEKYKIFVIRDLTELKQLEQKAAQSEKLVAMAELAAGVAHEIRNPLNSISTIAQQLAKDFCPSENEDEFRVLTEVVLKEIRRIDKTISDFLSFSKPLPLEIENFSSEVFFNEIYNQYKNYFKAKNIKFELIQEFKGKVLWDRNKIKQVVINLLENAADSISENGEVKILVVNENANIRIEISDTGKGISEEILKKIFNLYFTTKASGSGIGLSISQKIIFEHAGSITAESKLGVGTIMKITLPQFFQITNG